MFSQTVEYALRAMVQLSFTAPHACATAEMAKSTKVPRAYLSKVLQGLRRAALVNSQRGVGGGVCLARMPAEITLLEIVNAVEPMQRILTCPLGIESHGTRLCPLHRRVDEAIEAIEATFRATTLADIVDAPHGGSKPLCNNPTDMIAKQLFKLPCADACTAERPQATGCRLKSEGSR